MAAVLSADMDNTDKVVSLIEACRSLGLQIVPPDVNRSDYRFTIEGDQAVVYGLGALKGVGEGVIEDVEKVRKTGGPFRDLLDFCCRVNSKKTNRRVLEALIRAGAFEAFGTNRATLLHQLAFVLKVADQQTQNQQAGMLDLFADPVTQSTPIDRALLPAAIADWPDAQRLQGEKRHAWIIFERTSVRCFG